MSPSNDFERLLTCLKFKYGERMISKAREVQIHLQVALPEGSVFEQASLAYVKELGNPVDLSLPHSARDDAAG